MNLETPPSEPATRRKPLALAIVVAAGIVAAVLRVVPHPPNFSGVGALGLYGGGRLRSWQAFLLPLSVMILSDLALWTLTRFDDKYSLGHVSRLYVYASFMIYVLIGRWLCTRHSIGSIVLASTVGAVQFFIVTNFCDWLFQPWQPGVLDAYRYSRDLNGLMTCFAMALPFYRNDNLPAVDHPFMLFTDFRFTLVWTFLGDLIFTTVYLLADAKLGRWLESAPASQAVVSTSSGSQLVLTGIQE